MSLKARFRGVIRYQTGPPAIFLLILSRSERAGEFFGNVAAVEGLEGAFPCHFFGGAGVPKVNR